MGQTGGLLSHNIFVYCANNPVIFKDSNGFIIELSTDATDEQKKAYESAIVYLKQSGTAKALIEMLENSDEAFIITFNDNDYDGYNGDTNTISWDIDSGLIVSDGKFIQSAALGLAHEMGHASQDIDGTYWQLSYDDREADNLANCENPIANDLGEFTRKNYYDISGAYTMRNSTDWGTRGHIFMLMWYFMPENLSSGWKYDYTTK